MSLKHLRLMESVQLKVQPVMIYFNLNLFYYIPPRVLYIRLPVAYQTTRVACQPT